MSTGAAKETGINILWRRSFAVARSRRARWRPGERLLRGAAPSHVLALCLPDRALVLASRPAVSGPALSSALPLGPRYNRESVPEPTKVSSASSAAVTSKTADPETRANTT